MVQRIDVPRPFSAETLCRNIARQRGRGIHLHTLPPGGAVVGACGVWLATATDDHIFYENQTSRVHQEHIVLHELGHLLFNHHAVNDTMYTDVMGSFLPDLDPRMVTHLLGRTNYTTRQEQEAEMLASVIRTSADQSALERPRSVTGKLGAALGIEERDDE
ncbi:ImmA/IrrE family metallo-endopeptidase [Streptomyces griseus]|uniref:ImmA/IrrE family metallo-endopeptidase n=1 Tax=Streptomyces griseus TaxID=1911 RepID=UPI0018FE9606|nr:ImmA/IrrE family metallo-endopeptidase [Streptomyces griseus]